MATVSIPTNGLSLILNGSVIDDFIDGDFINVTLINELTSRLNGAKNSVTITERVDGNVGNVVFRVTRYSDSDVRLNAAWNKRPIEIFNGSLKEDYFKEFDGGELENWTLENGTFITPPAHRKSSQEGEYIVEYMIQFRNARRVI